MKLTKLTSLVKCIHTTGAYGGSENVLTDITRSVRDIFKELKTKSELHFREYNHDQHLKKYFKVLNHIINKEININILVINNTEAHSIAKQLNLTMMELRGLFYIKMPERLFYGVTRHLSNPVDIKIKIDRNDEYSSLKLYSKIKDQMNAHSVYRNKRYRITSVQSQESHKSIPLQIIDTFMGIVVFLMEQSYTGLSHASLIKGDLIYRFLSEGRNVERFQNQIKLFSWNGSENLSELSIGNYISRFMIHKTRYDVAEMIKLQAIRLKNPGLASRDYRLLMEYPNSRFRMLLGYIDELEGKGRNSFLLQ
ncbi:hypothetical protein [Paenibacillus jiagnxiensis]|uniref:hypothetical protein n=1 Tax=Paenibacillus jiagnxiensis TaxID=3228926 RepID=UPI0038D4014C